MHERFCMRFMGTLTDHEQKQAITVAIKVLNAYIRVYARYRK